MKHQLSKKLGTYFFAFLFASLVFSAASTAVSADGSGLSAFQNETSVEITTGALSSGDLVYFAEYSDSGKLLRVQHSAVKESESLQFSSLSEAGFSKVFAANGLGIPVFSPLSDKEYCTLPENAVIGNAAPSAAASASATNADIGGLAALNDGSVPVSSSNNYNSGDPSTYTWHNWGSPMRSVDICYSWDCYTYVTGTKVYWFSDGSGIQEPSECTVSYMGIDGSWHELGRVDSALHQFNTLTWDGVWCQKLRLTVVPADVGAVAYGGSGCCIGIREWQVSGYLSSEAVPVDPSVVTWENDYLKMTTGALGQLTSLKIVGDTYDTEYLLNEDNSGGQASYAGHQWFGELMFKVRRSGETNYTEQNTGRCTDGRQISIVEDPTAGNSDQYVVTYENDSAANGINRFRLTESYQLVGKSLVWTMTVANTSDEELIIGDWGVPLAFNEYWSGGDAIYETRVIDHSFVGKNSSYIYVQRPSGVGPFLVLTPDQESGSGFEYQDYWLTSERSSDEQGWCQDQCGWSSGLNVFYIHSDAIKSTNRGYLGSTSLTLAAGESKTYRFKVTVAESEDDMKSVLYSEGLVDAVAVPGMAYCVNMPGKVYLHTKAVREDIRIRIQCPHELKLFEGHENTVVSYMTCSKDDSNTYAEYEKTVVLDGEQYHVYALHFSDLGQHNVYVDYGDGQETCLQFYMMDSAETAIETHASFVVEKTQSASTKAFDDWMMDSKKQRCEETPSYWTASYWGWGDDWGYTHGTFLAEKNVCRPDAEQVEALDQYLTTCIWGFLMDGHHSDYLIHDFLQFDSAKLTSASKNASPTYRGYAYPHIYNTYFAMYKICSRYPDLIDYDEDAVSYLMKAYNICKALYSSGVGYNWETGVMGEMTTPELIAALKAEGKTAEASALESIMDTKYNNFSTAAYPYGSEYSYDNTGEEAVYTLAKMHSDTDAANAERIMRAVVAKTRACRGCQPVWYHYAVPTTICGEGWWNFQYTVALSGYCMDDYLFRQDTADLTGTEAAEAERLNYAAKIASLTVINSGQIDSDTDNIGAVAWTYQSRLGNTGADGTGGGKLHNGWRQMSGEADLNLWGAMRYLSSDVSLDPIFGLFGYGCTVEDGGAAYKITPLDGLRTRLHILPLALSIELGRDRYSYAEIAKDKSSIKLCFENIESSAHSDDLKISGLSSGSTYDIIVNGEVQSSFTAAGDSQSITVSLPQASDAVVVVSLR